MTGENAIKVRKAWGDAPEWVMALAKACDESSQAAVARRISYSAPTVSQVLSNTYRGDLVQIEGVVAGLFMGATVICPAQGEEIARNVCLDWQTRPYTDASSFHIKMHRACRSCPLATRNQREDAA